MPSTLNRPRQQRQPVPDGLVNCTMQDILNHLEWSRFEQSSPGGPQSFISGNQRKMGRASGRNDEDVTKYQFWPTAMAMGSLVGRQFNQMFAARCEYGEDKNDIKYNGAPSGHGLSFLAFDFARERLIIKAKLNFGTSVLESQIPPALRPLDAELSFEDIAAQGVHFTQSEMAPIHKTGQPPTKRYAVTVTISCRRPPRFYTPFEAHDEMLKSRGKTPDRRRATVMDFAVASRKERDAGPIQAIPEGPCGYPTFWNTYRWTFILPHLQVQTFAACMHKFRFLAKEDPDMDLLAKGQARWSTRKLEPAENAVMHGVPDMRGVQFSARVLIEGLISHGIIKPGDIKPLLNTLSLVAIVPAFRDRILESMYNEDRIRNVEKVVRGKAAYLRHIDPPSSSHLVIIRTVMVTPTRLLISPPQQEPSNSVTRRYEARLDGIIRVIFTDEEDRLHVADFTKQADEKRPDVGMMARVRRALTSGIKIGGKLFMPVASSASQQKDHAIWFIDIKMIDGLELRRWMGSVDETIVAKHAARMGLPFSTSRIVELNIKLGRELPDVKRNGHCFTDGCGIAGTEVMKEAAKALGTTHGLNATPSTIQFRLGGAKGVLACWPSLVGEHEVRMRPSLVKFQSALSDLNVVRLAKYQVAFLNRQFINIMCANGVPTELMVDIFNDAVANIKGMKDRVRAGKITKDDYNTMATCTEFPLSAVIKAGFHRDPMVLDIVEIIECRALQDLKWRARVKLPGGVFLIGISDELGVLREGELFCQFQENELVDARVITGEVLICRAPALHPGDVRRAWCVERPELRHLKNVIVFNTKGARDLPNMLGGGDLDGDDYTLIWDQRFVQTLKVQEAMDYTAPEPIRVAKVTQADLNENFVQYMLNDVLGRVDNLHLALSDKHTPFHEDCLHLSQVHSIAVDFAKTGIAATLDPKLQPKEWPDFMGREEVRPTYASTKILGELFRIVQPEPTFRPCDIRKINYPTDPRIGRYSIFGSLLDRLRPIKAQYENALHYDMRRYRVCEPEIPCGIAVINKRRKRARDQNINEPLRDSYNAHVMTAREAARQEIMNITFKSRLNDMQMVARHAYALTFEREHVEKWEQQFTAGMWGGHAPEHEEGDESRDALRPRAMTSFAWAFWEELIQIATMP